MDIESIIAGWVRTARTGAELSGDALATKLSFELGTTRGNTKANISHWETGKHSPSLEQILAIVKVTRIGLPDELIAAMQGEKRPSAQQGSPVDSGAPTPAESVRPSNQDSGQFAVPLDGLVSIKGINEREASLLRRFRMTDESGARMIEAVIGTAKIIGLGVAGGNKLEDGASGMAGGDGM